MTPEEAYVKCKYKRSRTTQLEIIIATNVYYSYCYATIIINRPFPLCHHIIFNSKYRDNYLDFIKSFNYDMKEIEEKYGEWLI